jgi:hypothetical protein
MGKELSGKFILPAKYPKAVTGTLGFACGNAVRTLRGGFYPVEAISEGKPFFGSSFWGFTPEGTASSTHWLNFLQNLKYCTNVLPEPF